MFKTIIGYPNYEVSDEGEVRSSKTGRILKLGTDNGGYHRVSLYQKGKAKKYYVHRLVATAFLTNHESKPQVNHKNWNKNDNRVENLEWNTSAENIQHAFANGLMENHNFRTNHPSKGKFGKDHFNSKPIQQFTKSGEFLREWGSTIDIQRELGIAQSSISKCCLGKRKSAGGFIFNIKN